MIYTNYYRVSDRDHSYIHAEAHERRADAVMCIADNHTAFSGLTLMGRTMTYTGSHVSDFGLGNPKVANFLAQAKGLREVA